jgi:hypothetical protein
MAKDLKYYVAKLLTLRKSTDDLLREMEEELAKQEPARVPRKRQNRKDQRVMNFEAFYNQRKLKKKC